MRERRGEGWTIADSEAKVALNRIKGTLAMTADSKDTGSKILNRRNAALAAVVIGLAGLAHANQKTPEEGGGKALLAPYIRLSAPAQAQALPAPSPTGPIPVHALPPWKSLAAPAHAPLGEEAVPRDGHARMGPRPWTGSHPEPLEIARGDLREALADPEVWRVVAERGYGVSLPIAIGSDGRPSDTGTVVLTCGAERGVCEPPPAIRGVRVVYRDQAAGPHKVVGEHPKRMRLP